jgi:hypothetical protein
MDSANALLTAYTAALRMPRRWVSIVVASFCMGSRRERLFHRSHAAQPTEVVVAHADDRRTMVAQPGIASALEVITPLLSQGSILHRSDLRDGLAEALRDVKAIEILALRSTCPAMPSSGDPKARAASSESCRRSGSRAARAHPADCC